MKDLIKSIIAVAISWIAFFIFIHITTANTWMPFTVFVAGVMGLSLISISIVVSSLFRQILKLLNKKNNIENYKND